MHHNMYYNHLHDLFTVPTLAGADSNVASRDDKRIFSTKDSAEQGVVHIRWHSCNTSTSVKNIGKQVNYHAVITGQNDGQISFYYLGTRIKLYTSPGGTRLMIFFSIIFIIHPIPVTHFLAVHRGSRDKVFEDLLLDGLLNDTQFVVSVWDIKRTTSFPPCTLDIESTGCTTQFTRM